MPLSSYCSQEGFKSPRLVQSPREGYRSEWDWYYVHLTHLTAFTTPARLWWSSKITQPLSPPGQLFSWGDFYQDGIHFSFLESKMWSCAERGITYFHSAVVWTYKWVLILKLCGRSAARNLQLFKTKINNTSPALYVQTDLQPPLRTTEEEKIGVGFSFF